MGLYENQEEVLVSTNYYHFNTAWRFDCINPGLGNRALHLHYFLMENWRLLASGLTMRSSTQFKIAGSGEILAEEVGVELLLHLQVL